MPGGAAASVLPTTKGSKKGQGKGKGRGKGKAKGKAAPQAPIAPPEPPAPLALGAVLGDGDSEPEDHASLCVQPCDDTFNSVYILRNKHLC